MTIVGILVAGLAAFLSAPAVAGDLSQCQTAECFEEHNTWRDIEPPFYTPGDIPKSLRPSYSPRKIEPAVSGGATIRTIPFEDGRKWASFVYIRGRLEAGDDRRFRETLLSVKPPVLVGIESPGGDLNAGIGIGRTIWALELSTVVGNEWVCASACALAWLAGRPRFAWSTSHIGFHAPRRSNDPEHQPDHVASAVVGAYLAELGLRTAAVEFITRPAPKSMEWLTPSTAREIGIYVEMWPTP